jgi:hypothetical protein
MKSIKLLLGTLSLALGFTSITTWAAQEAADKERGEKAEKPQPSDINDRRGEPICGRDE